MKNPDGYMYGKYYIPERMAEALMRWVEYGIEPGGFLRAVIRNDLAKAVALADVENLVNIPAYVAWFYNEAPAACWGSHEKANAWKGTKV